MPSKKDTEEVQEEVLEFTEPLYHQYEKKKYSLLYRLALDPGSWKFIATRQEDNLFNLTHDSGLTFSAELKEGTGKARGTYKIKGCVKSTSGELESYLDNVRINGVGEDGEKLRNAQVGAVYSLMAHWSLSKDVATVVLPTGTGKTETMLVATLVDKAEKTLVIVPNIDLKAQISEKFSTWGILRRLGVIPKEAPNPSVLVLNRILDDESCVESIEQADIVISTPALIARADESVSKRIRNMFSHVYFDEAHHVKAPEWNFLKNIFSQSKIVQFTATPYRGDRKPIEGKVVYNYPLSQAIKDECFSKLSLVSIEERNPRKKDKAIADAAIDRLRNDREAGWNRHRIMVRAATTKHAEELYSRYSEWFPKERIVLVHNGKKGRKAIVENIRNADYDIVVCVDMLKEGFDYPEFKIAAVHGVHKSLSVLLQFIGRFTRTESGLGDASFIVNYAEEEIPAELESLFQEGSGWEEVISEVADAKKAEAESLLTFLQSCKPYSGFDSADIEMNPKLVYPALSCVCYRCDKVEWNNFSSSFNLRKYGLSQPYINSEESVFYFSTQKREKAKWARTDKIRDQVWDLVVMHHDAESKILYVGYSEKRLDVKSLVESISVTDCSPINGDCVFRSFDSIKRLSIVHAGVFKPANHLHRYSRLSGADVTTELTRWKEGNRCQKSDFVGVGFRDGFPVSVGASVKGKVWSPARVGDLKEWKQWCLNTGLLITDEGINSNQILENSAEKVEISEYPENMIVLATDWSEELYPRMHKLTLERSGKPSFMLSECSLKFIKYKGSRANFSFNIFDDEEVLFSFVLGGEKGFIVEGLDKCVMQVEGLKSAAITLEQFFQENPPTMFLLNGCTIAGCIHTNYGDPQLMSIPSGQIECLDWNGVSYNVESLYKKGVKRKNSIQEYMMQRLVSNGATVVFNDDNSGESADIVAIFLEEELVRFELVHCKYSKVKAGARLSDLYDVCGQAIVSLRYKWKPEELLKQLERRNGTGVLAGKRFFHGNGNDIEETRQALKYSEVQFEFAIAQPGVAEEEVTVDMRNLLGSVYSTVIEMTETKLKCYFNTKESAIIIKKL